MRGNRNALARAKAKRRSAARLSWDNDRSIQMVVNTLRHDLLSQSLAHGVSGFYPPTLELDVPRCLRGRVQG